MPMSTKSRWKEIWFRLGVAVPQSLLYDDLVSKYCQVFRKYHTLQHLDECLERLDEVRDLAERPDEVEMALWFHDAVYDVRRHDNEQRSADWACESLSAAGVSSDVVDRVRSLILATDHRSPPQGRDAEIIVDIDLAILGAESGRFDEYERQIREEYDWVAEDVFRRERGRILTGFLARPRIFRTDHFFGRYEARARDNITGAIRRYAI